MIRKLMTIVALVAAGATAFADTHKLATFNVRYTGAATDTEGKAWGERGPLCRDVILNYDLDIVGFQELSGAGRAYRNPKTGRTQLADLRAWLPDYELIAWDRDGSKALEYVGTAYKKSRYELLDQGWFFLGPTPEKYSFGWDTKIETHPRILGWLKLKDKKTGEQFVYATTHTNDGWSLDGPYGSQLIANKMKEIAGNLPVMVVADYNTNRVAVHAQMGLKAYHAAFHDAALDVPEAMNYSLPVTNRACNWTYNAFNPVSNLTHTGSEIDFQFYKGMKILERHIITEEFTLNGVQYPSSDHFPLYVVAELAPVAPKNIYVDNKGGSGGNGSKTAPFATIADAIAASDIDDTIYVTAGTYSESVQPKYSVSILGGYDSSFSKVEGMTEIDGATLAYPQIYAPTYVNLTLKNLKLSNYASTDAYRDGAVLFRGNTLDMENMVFENNTAKQFGGAVSVVTYGSTKYCDSNNVKAVNCVFRGNKATTGGAMAVGLYDRFTLDGCSFEDNTATDGGSALYLTFGAPDATRIWFTEARADLFNSSFSGNKSSKTGTIKIDDTMPNVNVNVVNCTVAGNALEAGGGLASIVKTFGGSGIYSKMVNRPADCTLSKVGNSKLNLGHITVVGNHASSTAPANFLGSAINADGGELKIVNSIIAGNTTNGTNAVGDIMLGNTGILKSELRNVLTAATGVNFTPESTSTTCATVEEGTAAVAALMAGNIDNGKFMPLTVADEEGCTRYVPFLGTKYGSKDLATLTVLVRNLEKEFSVDLNNDGSVGQQHKTDQLGQERAAKSMPGAVEFTKAYEGSGVNELAEEPAVLRVIPTADGVKLLGTAPLGEVKVVDMSGRTLACATTQSEECSLQFDATAGSVFVVMCKGTSFKIIK